MNLALILGRPLIVTLMGLPLYLFGKAMTKEILLPFAVGDLLALSRIEARISPSSE